MPDELVLYSNPRSRGRIARWMLEEVGQPFRVEVLEYGAPMRSPEFLRINPMGKVPALTHGNVVVTESAAICAYLADAFPAAGLAPALGNAARGAYFRWLFFAAGPLEAAWTNNALGITVPDERRSMVGYGSLGHVLDTLDGLLGTVDYVAGGAFSAADLYLGAQLGFGMMFAELEKRPSFERYVARLNDRPAARRARKADDVTPSDVTG